MSRTHQPGFEDGQPLLYPIAKHLALQDIKARCGKMDVRITVGIGDEFLINNNLWVQFMSNIIANEAVLGPTPKAP